ncbi:metallophosphoesterase family protein [Pseudodesulfovibrio sp. zrk46]|uniref:metallophosphoesterase family protein n=1 Tax=Pseudodesulfovibrio sp. zrk46 TaxID=2725288 RepID=UPI001449A7DF|nr:metallophosphoesterase family protein [Pseudodesulfovibrio sp. zrk46]QJB55944.1 metallophosphoesterase [Pseudodesulfovibrio sp. zrk46]
MPKIAVFSDVHSNYEALLRVFEDIDKQGVDSIYCLGDLVGYGPQPQECCDLVRERGESVQMVQGNHEQGLINIYYLQGFNQPAKDALRKTREMVTDETYEWLVAHPKSLSEQGCRFVHGVPPNSASEYIWKYEKEMGEVFSRYTEGVCFVGHTHDLMRFTCRDRKASEKLPLNEGELRLDKDTRHLLNIGAVGQPRDGDNSAKYALYDTDAQILTMRFIPYDIKKTADLIRACGLHRGYADRLW